jgi:Arc/MetJ-type ribon-helix-helix transcriptional regulator
MDLHTPTMLTSAAVPTRLEPVLVRLPPKLADQLRQLARSTRIRQSDYLREAVADLIAKYSYAQPSPEQFP